MCEFKPIFVSNKHSKCFNEMGSYRGGCDEGYRKLWSSEYRDQDINCIGKHNKEIMLDDTAGKDRGRGKKGGKEGGVEGEERREDGGSRWRGGEF